MIQTDPLFPLQGAYLHWAEYLLRESRPDFQSLDGNLLEQVFLSGDMSPKDFVEKIQGSDDYFLDATEQQYLLQYLEESDNNGVTEAFVYRSVDGEFNRPLPPDGFSLRHIGAITSQLNQQPLVVRRIGERSELAPETVIGVIDDGLAYLNRRFVNETGKTRFFAVWQQCLPVLTGGTVQLGDVLDGKQINDQLQQLGLLQECDIYRRERRRPVLASTGGVFDERFPLGRRESHGTSMLDLAAGAAPGEPMSQLPLIGVQLPAPIFDDTSGKRLDTNVLMGLRWMIAQLQPLGTKKLIVNISLGVTAGAKDGKDFLSQCLQVEVQRAAKRGMSVHLVFPYGNDYETGQIAEVQEHEGHFALPDLLIVANDRTPSFVEIRLPGVDLSQVSLTVEPPGTAAQQLDFLPVGHWTPIRDNFNCECARLYHDAAVARGLILAIAPTATWESRKLCAPCNNWRISAQHSGAKDVLIAQIQRDDRLPGSRLWGRQARFDDKEAHTYDRKYRNYRGFSVNGRITHAGTNSAYTGTRKAHLSRVAAASGRFPHIAITAARYSAEGSWWSGSSPDLAILVESSVWLTGRRATGISSGTTTRVSGTSVASALETRRQANKTTEDPLINYPRPDPRLGAAIFTEEQ